MTARPSARESGGRQPIRDLLDRVEADEPGKITFVAAPGPLEAYSL
jgi:hypothetical protein